MTFSDRLYEAMREKHVSIRTLSEMTNIPKSAIQRYTSGETNKIPIDRMKLMAKALGIDPAHVMVWDEIESSLGSDTPAAQQLRVIGGELSRASQPSDPRKAEIIAIYDSMNDAGRESLLLAARGFAGSPAMCQDGASNTEKTV